MKGNKMKKAITLAVALAFITPAQANEIAGTRVEGQGAVCAEGQGKAVEINIALKKEFSYCFELPKPTPKPTPTPTPTLTPTPTPTPTPTVSVTTEPTAEPTVTPTNETTNENTNETTVEESNNDTSTATVEPTPTANPTPTPTPTPTLPALPETPERSNVIEANVTTQVVTVREETVEEWLTRIFASWNNWYAQLQAWFESLTK